MAVFSIGTTKLIPKPFTSLPPALSHPRVALSAVVYPHVPRTPLLPGPVPTPNAHRCCPAALSAPSVCCALRPMAQLSPAHLPGLGLVGWEEMDEPSAGWSGASNEDEYLSSCPNDTQACCHTAFLAQNAMDGPESWHLAQGLGTVLVKSLEIPFHLLPFLPLLWTGCRCEMKYCFFCNAND